MSPSHDPRRAVRKVAWIVAFLLFVSAGGAAAQAPTVNGWFYGDGDDAKYSPYSVSEYGSVLYSYFDAPNSTLYVALVVDHSVNDSVCSSTRAYTSSAGWDPPRPCDRLTDSEFAQFTLECAPGSPNAWDWQQGFSCAQNLGNPPSDWVSDPTCGSSSPAADWPPSIVSSTSFVHNVNTYQADPSPSWDMYVDGTAVGSWKSPWVASAPNDATAVPGYPTFSGGGYQWEWSMVYEWSVKLGPEGTDCGDESIFFVTGSSHHSPSKNNDENDEFNDPPEGPLSDWGDLPDEYGTTEAVNGPRHHIKVSGPYLGQAIQAELDGQPTSDATGDGSEEDGVTVTVTSDWTLGSTQEIEVEVGNAPSGALLGGWFDWNNDGDFDDPNEFVQATVSEGTNTLSVTVGDGFDWQNDSLYTRFRVFSSASAAPGGSLDVSDSTGTATDGEVEDHTFEAGSLPVTLNAFTTEGESGSPVTVRWQTASETENVAFEIWGLVAGEWQVLTDLIESHNGTSALAQRYEARIDAPPGLTSLQLVDYDTRGRIERFGAFQVGESYGDFQPVRTIDWTGPRTERVERLRERGFEDTARGRGLGVELGRRVGRSQATEAAGADRWKNVRGGSPIGGPDTRYHGAKPLEIETRRGKPADTPGGGPPADDFPSEETVRIETGPMTHVAVTEPGVQRLTYEALRDGGLDLAGVQTREIAVTFRGEPVPRWIDGPPHFGPGSTIEFLGDPPQGDDALYIDAALYQISVDRSLAREPGKLGQGNARNVSASYLEETGSDRPGLHHPLSPTGDPWVERLLLVRRGRTPTVTLDLPVEGPVADGPGELVVGLGTISNLPDLLDAQGNPIPEHNVEVWHRGPDSAFQLVTSSAISGQEDWTIEATLPEGSIAAGLNQVELRFSTDYFFSLVVVDRYGLRYPTPYRGPSLDFARDPWADGYRVEGFSTPSAVAYAEGADGSLTRVEPRVIPAGGGYAVELRQLDAERFWVTDAPHTPDVFTTEAPPDLLAGPADLVVIAGSSFVGSRALEDYVAEKAAFDPVVIDVEDVYNAVGFGMALPSAVTDYLAARDAVYPFSHVQLVGTDCYDRRSYVSQCLSFFPLPTARVGVTRFSPSQNRLVDLNGDGVADKAVGQFSVRDEAELATIVDKGSAWETSGVAGAASALLIAEEGDGHHDFLAQIERLRRRLGWSDTDVIDLAEHPSMSTARDAMRASLATGRTVTVFSGHSSPTVWSFRSLLTPGSAAALTNHGRPTIMVPLACETTYDISPNANVLGHQLLYAGDQGALTISGAVSLSNLGENERMANYVLDGLKAGLTLGEAVQAGRQALGTAHLELQDNWITQGDATTRLRP